jgi:hypothetical protein
MIPAFFLYIAMGLGTISETPFLAWDLATNMSRCHRIEWSKMTDDANNVKFIITFHKMSLRAELGFEKTLSKHRCCQSEIRRNK